MPQIMLIALLVILSASCCSTEYIKVPAIVPVVILDKPTIPNITPEQEEAIRNAFPDAYADLAAREESLVQHIKRQDGVILVHNEKADNTEDEER